jgi:hypothetical protein
MWYSSFAVGNRRVVEEVCRSHVFGIDSLVGNRTWMSDIWKFSDIVIESGLLVMAISNRVKSNGIDYMF